MKNKRSVKIELICYLEISIIILGMISFSYMMSDALNENKIQTNENKFGKFLDFIINNLKKPVIASVSAEEIKYCCEQDKQGSYCQDYDSSVISENCDSYSPVKCDNNANCVKGCCYSTETGLCSISRKINCDGEFISGDATCGAVKCQKGCCTLGNNNIFTTPGNCEIETQMLGLNLKFDASITSESSCIFLTIADEEGACVIGGSCRRMTGKQCKTSGGSFSLGYLCSNSELETDCEKESYTSCIDGKDEVYWFDSCGNIENIFGTSYDGKIKTKGESCTLADSFGNANSCGNCDYNKGSICGMYKAGIDKKPNKGDYVCRDLNCEAEIDGKTITKENGESWCEYEGAIGVGKTKGSNEMARDVVGSRHLRKICVDGEVISEPCADYRNSVCVWDEDKETGKTYSSCKMNSWQECIVLNSDKAGVDKCAEKEQCWVKSFSIDDFKLKMCLPKYPPGFDIVDENSQSDAKDICSVGNQKCQVIYIKDWKGNCNPEVNENCLKQGFTDRMNEVCASLGDCGGYVNIAGEYTSEGFSVKKGIKKVSSDIINIYISFANPLKWINQKPDLAVPSPEYIEGLKGILKGGGTGKASPGLINTAVKTVATVATIINAVDLIIIIIWFPYLWPFAILDGILIALGLSFMKIGDVCKKVTVKYECKPWEAPSGGDNCEKCNEGDYCTKYRCQSLGLGCELVGEGSENPVCIWKNPGDSSPPKISPLFEALKTGYSYNDVRDNGFKLRENSGDCIQEFTSVSFGITTDERALCRISGDKDLAFEDMDDFSIGYIYNHTSEISMPSVSSLAVLYNVTENEIRKVYGELNVYIKCKDTNGNINSAVYIINSCVQQGPDKTAPYIQKTFPESGSYVKYDEITQDLKAWINEPSECRWDKIDTGFNLMKNEMVCENDIEAQELYGYSCETTLTGLSKGSNDVYIKCKDQPWYKDKNESLRNTMTTSYLYDVIVSENKLKIDSIKVRDPIINTEGSEFFTGGSYMVLELGIQTSGGVNGEANCEYNYFEDFWAYLENTGTNIHTQSGLQMIAGENTIKVRCIDIAGNTAESSVTFKVDVDNTGPVIVRVYNENGLKIITTEPGTCKYSFNADDLWNNKTIMSASGNEYTGIWEAGKTYYIECRDSFENIGGSIVVQPYNTL
ncbi:MAG: hypothetical protein WC438_00850 [Candidatus Pacearchaeota archaeon]